MKNIFTMIFVLPALFIMGLLTGCGGGGGGTTNPFVKWSAISFPDTVKAEGISNEKVYTGTGATPSVVVDKGVDNSSSATIGYRADGSIDRVSINSATSSVTWNENSGDLIDDTTGLIAVVDSTLNHIGFAANTPQLGWDYQTYGMWLSTAGDDLTTGVISAGAPTAGSAIPASGSATFTGFSSGYYVNASGTDFYVTESDVTAVADFSNRSISLSSYNTEKTDATSTTLAPNLGLDGVLTYSPATNAFSGNVSTSGMTGRADGQFYGPNAEEIGGIFSVDGSGFETYNAAFGAQR